jgi:hypothetical protein
MLIQFRGKCMHCGHDHNNWNTPSPTLLDIPTTESITIPIAEYEAIKPSKMALDCIAKMVADEMEKCVKNGANSISMPDELVAVAMWLCDMEKYIDKAKGI